MAGITLAQAEAQLAAWMEASLVVATGQAYEIDTGSGRRSLTRVNAEHIDRMISFWDAKVKALTSASAGGRRRVRYVVPE